MQKLISKAFSFLDHRGMFDFLDDKLYLELSYRAVFGKKLDLVNPKTYSEKLQWLKLYDHRPEYSSMVDKYEVKRYVSERIGAEHVIPTLGVWDSFDQIDFSLLPNQFVLKCTHDSGGLVICKDKESFDVRKAENKIRKSLQHNYFLSGREWPYKNVKPRILAETYMEDPEDMELRDYKFFAFDGEVKALFIATDRGDQSKETKFDFFDADFVHLPLTNGHPNAQKCPHKPACFDEMKHYASLLSKDIPQARIDFYEVRGKVYFGEITFFHWSGFKPFDPPEWDLRFGEWIKLPEQRV